MPKAKLTLTIPDDVWIGALSRSFPDLRIKILAAMADGADGVGLAELLTESLPSVLSAIESHEDVLSLAVLNREPDRALVQFTTTTPLLLLSARDSGVPLEMPFSVADGEATLEVTAPQRKLSALGDQLAAFNINFTVDYIQQYVTEEPLLTDRQRRIITAAVEAGYYDTPRETSLTELADRLDIAKSTASETLHRAEERIIKEFVESLSPAERPD